MDIQRLRNLTTGVLHTNVNHVYEDLEFILRKKGLMTHMLPGALRSVEPWLRKHVTDPRFWNREYDITHTGEYQLPKPTVLDRLEIFKRYKAQPNQFDRKNIVLVQL